MATTAPTPTIVSSFAHVPLTTTFSRPTDCGGLYVNAGFITAIDIASSCLPSGFDPEPTSFFSPGLVCPSGYVSACHDSTGVASVTTVTCCPTYNDEITLSCVTTSTLRSVWSTLFCTWIAPPQNTTLPITESAGGVTSTIQAGFTSPGGINALGVRMVYQSSDLTTSQSTSNIPTLTSTSATGAGTSATTSGAASASTSGLSTGAIIAIAVVIPVVVLGIAAALFFWWKRRKSNTVSPASGPTISEKDASQHGNNQATPFLAEMSGNDQLAQSEMYHAQRPPAELPGDQTAPYGNNETLRLYK